MAVQKPLEILKGRSCRTTNENNGSRLDSAVGGRIFHERKSIDVAAASLEQESELPQVAKAIEFRGLIHVSSDSGRNFSPTQGMTERLQFLHRAFCLDRI